MKIDDEVEKIVSEKGVKESFQKVSRGSYSISTAESKSQVFVRVLCGQLMVRVGGGWQTLEAYIDRL